MKMTKAVKALQAQFPRWAYCNTHPCVNGFNSIHQFFVGGKSFIQVLEEYDEDGAFLGFSILGLLEN